MNSRILTVVGMFVFSLMVGYNLLPSTVQVQAQPVIPSPIEMPSISKLSEVPSVNEVNVVYDRSTEEVSVVGTTDTRVNVSIIGDYKPVIKWKTKKEIKVVNTGYPFIKSIGLVSEEESKPRPLSEIIKENNIQKQ